jgi:hypothetical protein
MASKYSWPLPGEGVTAEELALAEIRAALPGVNSYSGQARRDAMLAEIVAILYNAQPALVPLLQPTRLVLTPILLSSSAGSAVTVDVSTGTYFSVSVNSTGGYTINSPTNTVTTGQLVIVEVHNGSGGAITTTWGGNWHLSGGAWTDPGNTKSRFAIFLQLASVFQEVVRSAADT